MAEDFAKNNIESEIALLSEKIAEKRRQLEESRGVVQERELVKSVLGEKISATIPQSIPVQTASISNGADRRSSAPATQSPSKISYLDSLDEKSQAEIMQLVESVFANGLEKTLKTLELVEPFIIDAFHDVLTDRLYGELKKKGVLK